jgi:hypothetical protein
MSHHNIPSERTLQFLNWTQERARKAPYVTWRGEDAFIADRQVVFPEDQERVIERCYQDLSQSVGYNRAYSYIAGKYIGVRRRAVQDFLRKQKRHHVDSHPP